MIITLGDMLGTMVMEFIVLLCLYQVDKLNNWGEL